MAQQFWLGRQDGPGGINLLDRGRITVRHQGFSAPTPAPGLRERVVTLNLRLSGPTVGDWQAARAEIDRALGAIDPAPLNRRYPEDVLVLSVTLDGEHWTYIDVKCGSLEVTELLPRGRDAFATLTLTCLPLLRTDAVQAMNLLASPTDPTAAAWTRTNVSVAAANAVAPDGSLTAATLLETTATGAHEIVQQIAKAATAVQYTLSCYVKANGRAAAALYLADGSGANGVYGGYDLAGGTLLYPAGTAGSGWSGASATITDAGDGWWRIALTGTSNAATTLRCYVQLHNGAGTAYAGDAAKGVRVWGAQLEEGATAGLLLVPAMLPDTVWAAHTIPGYTYQVSDYTADPDNLWTGSWDYLNLTQTTGQSNPSGDGGGILYTDNNSTTATRRIRNTTAVVPSGLPQTYTFALYLKNSAGRNTPTIAIGSVSTGPTGSGVSCTVNLTDGTFGAATTGGSFTLVSRETIDVGSGWWWVRLSVSVPTGVSTLYGFVFPNGLNTYGGNVSYGFVVWRPQMVAGETIDKPLRDVVVDDDVVPAETTATGNQMGAYLYGIPGDAPAILRVELEDATTDGDAVNRVALGGWSGPGVRLGALTPFTLLDAAEGAGQSSGSASQVGTWTPALTATPLWQTIGTTPIPAGVRGRFDVVLRARDSSPNLGAPRLTSVTTAGGIYARQVARVTTVLAGPQTSISLGIPATTPGATLVLMAQGMSGGMSIATPSITASGGLTWSPLHSPSGLGRTGIRMWYVANAAAVSATLTVGWSASMKDGTVALIEIIGAAAASLDQTDVKFLDQRNANTLSSIASVTTTQAAELLLSAGLGLFDWSQAFTVPIGDATWYGVSSLTSGAIYAKSVATTGTYTARWMRFSLERSGTPPPEPWLVTLASFKAAAATGANIGTGRWSVCVTALDAAGVEGVVSVTGAVDVVATSQSVTARWEAPANGTPATYRVYRNRGTGWAYATVAAPATTYTFTDETGLTSGSPPTTPPPVAAWRLAVALPSGETLWEGRAVASERANGLFEDIALGSVALPPTVGGEGETPSGALLAVQVAHQTGAPTAVNGVWLAGAETGQVAVERRGLAETAPLDWVIDTNRDERLAAWLEDAGTEAGQLVQRVPGALTVEPGNALILTRPQVAGGLSDLVTADLRVRRVRVTPRWRYLAGGTP